MVISDDFFPWIEEHRNDDPAKLRLKYGRSRSDEILQVECRRKYAAKLGGLLAANPQFVFPTALSGEQSTSLRLAEFHASLIAPGSRVADLTAGLGVDAYAMSRRCDVTAVERDPEVAAALRHNYADIPTIKVVEADCREFVAEAIGRGERFDAVFIDPARRAADGSRVYALDDCEPDVVAMMPGLLKIACRVIVKASPMLDITHTLGRLPSVSRVIVLGTPTECKELDLICVSVAGAVQVDAVTLGNGFESSFSFSRLETAPSEPRYEIPSTGDYVFDPYPAVMKSGAMHLIGPRFNLGKLSDNTHLWTAKEPVPDFPGHVFKVEDVVPYASKNIKRYAARYPRVSVTARNFDPDAAALKKKLGVSDGSDLRLFAVTARNNTKLLITCRPV